MCESEARYPAYRTDVKLDGIRGGGTTYPGKPSCSDTGGRQRCHKTEPSRRTRSGKGAEGGRFADSTDDSGPEKPGNRVEGKTPTTGEGEPEPDA